MKSNKTVEIVSIEVDCGCGACLYCEFGNGKRTITARKTTTIEPLDEANEK